MIKELGDLRKIALSLEEMTDINSEEIPAEVGDLRRIAEALEKNAGIDSAGISPKIGDLKRISDAVENLELNGGGSAPILVEKQTVVGNLIETGDGTVNEYEISGIQFNYENIPIINLSINDKSYLCYKPDDQVEPVYGYDPTADNLLEALPIVTIGLTLDQQPYNGIVIYAPGDASSTSATIEIKEVAYPSGQLEIYENGIYNVAAYESVNVATPYDGEPSYGVVDIPIEITLAPEVELDANNYIAFYWLSSDSEMGLNFSELMLMRNDMNEELELRDVIIIKSRVSAGGIIGLKSSIGEYTITDNGSENCFYSGMDVVIEVYGPNPVIKLLINYGK